MLFKKIKHYFYYLKQLKSNWYELSGPEFAMTHDWFWRVGTIINLPPDIVPQYGDPLIKENVKNYIAKVKEKMHTLGLMELIYVKEVKKLDEFNVKVVFGYKLLKLSDIIYFLQNSLVISLLIGFIYFLIKFIFF